MSKDALDEYPSKQEILNTIFDAVYAQYPKKEWQKLSDDDVDIIKETIDYSCYPHSFARAIEQALKEKNRA